MNLELADTIELVEELSRRFDSFLILGLKASANQPDENGEPIKPLLWKYKGGVIEAVGMCQIASALITSEMTLGPLPKDAL